MTQLLEKAFEGASKLPDIEQNTLVKWDRAFAGSEDILGKLADEAIIFMLSRNIRKTEMQ